MILKVKVDGGFKLLEAADKDLDSRYPGQEWVADIVTPIEALERFETELALVGLAIHAYEDKLPFEMPHYGALITGARHAIKCLKDIMHVKPVESAGEQLTDADLRSLDFFTPPECQNIDGAAI